MKVILHRIEYALLRLGLWWIDGVSAQRAARMAAVCGSIWYRLDASRRRTAQANIRRSGLCSDEAAVRETARRSFRHFGILAVESLKADTVFNETNWRDGVDWDIDPATQQLLDDPAAGLILVSGHFGNWELAARLLAYAKPVVAVARRMNNPLTDRALAARRDHQRLTLTPKRDANLARLLQVVKQGRILALLADQHARAGGMMIDFFGSPASTYTSPAMLHLVTGAPICFGYCLRLGPMRYAIRLDPPFVHRPTGRREVDKRIILEYLNTRLESAIRLAPDQYLWAHRRWR